MLKKWIKSNIHFIPIEVTKLNWISDFFPGYHDYSFVYNDRGVEISSRGQGKSEEEAFLIGFSELVERVACHDNNIATNGVASHLTKEMASYNATKELIERDNILVHLLTDTPFLFDGPNKLLDRYISLAEKYGAKLEWARTKCRINGFYTTVIKANLNKGGGVWGFGCEKELMDSYQHALIEMFSNLIAYNEGKIRPLSLSHFKNQKLISGLDHKRLHMSEHLLPLKVKKEVEERDSQEIEISYRDLTITNKHFREVPLFVVQAISDELQPLFTGETIKEKVNASRLKVFSKMKNIVINKIIHPIG